jgi:hypothetical protein
MTNNRPPVNLLADRIKAHVEAGHRSAMKVLLKEHTWEALSEFVANADAASCTHLERALDAWESTRKPASLHEEPKKDGFQHETPIRAFTTWTADGYYALGKGFRPSLQHLVPYLNAMEQKEGWRLVQVLEAGSQTPSFLFRRERPMYRIDIPPMGDLDLSPEFKARMEEFLSNCPIIDGQGVRLHPSLDDIDTRLPDPVMPEVRERFNEQRDFGDEDPGCDDNDGLALGHVTVPGPVSFDQTPERIVRVPQALGAPYQAASVPRVLGDPLDVSVPGDKIDDPVNPKHYNGTGCAEIAENLPGNLAHAITYVWRAGDKPDQPELTEIDKALWWMDREMSRSRFLDFNDDDEDYDDRVPADMLKEDQEVFYVPTLHAYKKPHPKKIKVARRNPVNHPFYIFVSDRVGAARLTAWKASTVYAMAFYAIEHKTGALQSAINNVKQRRGSLARTTP